MMHSRNKKRYKIPTIHPSWHALAASILFFVSVVLSKQAELLGWEEPLFLAIYNLPDFFRPVFIVATWFGAIQMLGIVTLIFVYIKKNNAVIRLLMVSSMAYLLAGIGKSLWGRTRPDEILGVVARDYSYGPGFPSGHTALAVAMAMVVGHYLPKKYRWVVAVWIMGVGLSRIYLGVHAPLDIIGGFAIGWFSYMVLSHVRLYPVKFGKRRKNTKLACTKIDEKISKKRTAQQTIIVLVCRRDFRHRRYSFSTAVHQY